MADQHQHDEVVCQAFVELVTDYLEGALPEDRRDLVEEHLVICDACKTYLEQIEATVEALPDAVHDEPVPSDTRAALLSAFHDWRREP
jgi:anti-sigma factor RsiW